MATRFQELIHVQKLRLLGTSLAFHNNEMNGFKGIKSRDKYQNWCMGGLAMEPTKVVLRFKDGRVLKGFTQDFFPHKDRFHLFLIDKPPGLPIEVFMKELKAVFAVRDFVGNSRYAERKTYLAEEKPPGLKIEVTFADGEVLVGSTLGYDLKRLGFFVFPADPDSNNIRTFVVSSGVGSVRRF
jgi:hypothetical protein